MQNCTELTGAMKVSLHGSLELVKRESVSIENVQSQRNLNLFFAETTKQPQEMKHGKPETGFGEGNRLRFIATKCGNSEEKQNTLNHNTQKNIRQISWKNR